MYACRLRTGSLVHLLLQLLLSAWWAGCAATPHTRLLPPTLLHRLPICPAPSLTQAHPPCSRAPTHGHPHGRLHFDGCQHQVSAYPPCHTHTTCTDNSHCPSALDVTVHDLTPSALHTTTYNRNYVFVPNTSSLTNDVVDDPIRSRQSPDIDGMMPSTSGDCRLRMAPSMASSVRLVVVGTNT